MKKFIISFFILAMGISLAGAAYANNEKAIKAEAIISGCVDPNITGFARLREERTEEGIKKVHVTMMVKGLSRGKHAVHIHEFGECIPCSSAGGHFDAGPFGFSSPDGNHPFHSGDLINIEVNRKGIGHLNTITSRITLSPGPLSIFDDDGSAFIIHVNPDTYCPDGPRQDVQVVQETLVELSVWLMIEA